MATQVKVSLTYLQSGYLQPLAKDREVRKFHSQNIPQSVCYHLTFQIFNLF